MQTALRQVGRVWLLAAGLVLCGWSVAAAQGAIPQPAGPVTVCGTQAAPAADSHQLVWDGGAAEAVTLTAPAAAACPGGSTHSFTLPAARFVVGTHTIQVRSINQFGSTDGPVYTVVVGIAPGAFTPTAVIPED